MAAEAQRQDPEVGPPPDAFIRHRWIPAQKVSWAEECNRIMLEHGAVTGRSVYDSHHKARWRVRYLIRLLVELRLHDRWELKEHVDKKYGGFVWTLEYVGGKK